MIEGIEVLSETQLIPIKYIAIVVLGAALLILITVSIIAWIDSVYNPEETPVFITAIIGVVLIVLYLIFGTINCLDHQYTQYEVIISDDVNFKEFYDKYEVITTKGKIYIIREKENTDDRN